MQRIKIDLLALGFATAVMALCAGYANSENPNGSKKMTLPQARAEAALYLDGPVTKARLHHGQRWAVTDGRTTAWLDARTGELIEVELHPAH